MKLTKRTVGQFHQAEPRLPARPTGRPDGQGCTKRSGLIGSSREGFTIIELLVVLSVIALFSSVVFALVSNTRANSRDAKREQDLKSLQDALAIYATNSGTYPVTGASGIYLTGNDSVSSALIASGVIPAIPLDPLNTNTFRYQYASADGFTYVLIYSLETSNIPGKSAGAQQAVP